MLFCDDFTPLRISVNDFYVSNQDFISLKFCESLAVAMEKCP